MELYLDEYQIVILHLTDGRKIHATVPAFTTDVEEIGVVKVQITEPRKLTDGNYWAKESDNA